MNPFEARKLNCISHWHPLIEGAVPTPRTIIVRTDMDLLALLDGKSPVGFDAFIGELSKAGESVGYPFFLRTGQTSGKHDWKNTCFVPDKESIPRHVAALVEYSEMVDLVGLPWDVWAVREMLPTMPFGFAFQGMPVVREYRAFVDGDKVKCLHPDWPKEALAVDLKGHDPKSPEWAAVYETLCRLKSMDEEQFVSMLAAMAGKAVGGEWSVDVLETRRGWCVTDMAIASMSYHWPGCRNG